MSLRSARIVVAMGTRDFVHEGRLSFCNVIGIAAVLAPMLVLFGLKFGVVSTMTSRLIEDPRVRAIQPIGQGRYDGKWFVDLAARSEAGFVVPSTRFLAATISLRNAASTESEPVQTQMLPTAAGDPLLPEGLPLTEAPLDTSPRPIVLARPVAEKLRIAAGDLIDGRIGRTVDGEAQSARLRFRVAGILPLSATDQELALVELAVLNASEDYREGFDVPELGWPGGARPSAERVYASFRLYARSIYDVGPLRDWLAGRQVDVVTRAGEIETIDRLDRGLTTLFVVIAGLAGVGYLLTLTVSLWGTVLRKQRELSLLRLIGFSTGAIGAFPMIHAGWAAMLGSACAVGVAHSIAPLFNHLFAGQVRGSDAIFKLLPAHVVLAVAITLLTAMLAAVLAGLRAAAISPGEGLRDE